MKTSVYEEDEKKLKLHYTRLRDATCKASSSEMKSISWCCSYKQDKKHEYTLVFYTAVHLLHHPDKALQWYCHAGEAFASLKPHLQVAWEQQCLLCLGKCREELFCTRRCWTAAIPVPSLIQGGKIKEEKIVQVILHPFDTGSLKLWSLEWASSARTLHHADPVCRKGYLILVVQDVVGFSCMKENPFIISAVKQKGCSHENSLLFL